MSSGRREAEERSETFNPNKDPGAIFDENFEAIDKANPKTNSDCPPTTSEPRRCLLKNRNSWFIQAGFLETVPASLDDDEYWRWELGNMFSLENPLRMILFLKYPHYKYTAKLMRVYEENFIDLKSESSNLQILRSVCYGIASEKLPNCKIKMRVMANWILGLLYKWTLKKKKIDQLEAAILFDVLIDWNLLDDKPDQITKLSETKNLERRSSNGIKDQGQNRRLGGERRGSSFDRGSIRSERGGSDGLYPENQVAVAASENLDSPIDLAQEESLVELEEWYCMDRSQALKSVLAVIQRTGKQEWNRHKLQMIQEIKSGKEGGLRSVNIPGVRVKGLDILFDVWRNEVAFTDQQIDEIKYMQQSIMDSLQCQLHDYGSAMTKLTDKGSDWDCMFLISQLVQTEAGSQIAGMSKPLYDYQINNLKNKESQWSRQVATNTCNELDKWIARKTELGSDHSYEIRCIARARKPRLVVRSRKSGVELDICISHGLDPLCNSALLLNYTNMDPRVKPIIVFVKSWSKARRINGTLEGNFSSYAFTLTCLTYLIKVGVLENIQMPTAVAEHFGIKRQFDIEDECLAENPDMAVNHYDELPWSKFRSTNSDSIEKLIVGYFDHMVWDVDWDSVVLSCRTAPLDLNKIDWASSAAKNLSYVPRTDAKKKKNSQVVPLTTWPKSDWLENYLTPRNVAPEDWLYNHPDHNLHVYFATRPLSESLRFCCVECPTENERILQCHGADQSWSLRMELFRAWILFKGNGRIADIIREYPTASGGEQSQNVRCWIWQQVYYDWPNNDPAMSIRRLTAELMRAESHCETDCKALRKFQKAEPSLAVLSRKQAESDRAKRERRKTRMDLEQKAITAQKVICDLQELHLEPPEEYLEAVRAFEEFQKKCDEEDAERNSVESDQIGDVWADDRRKSWEMETKLRTESRKQYKSAHKIEVTEDSGSEDASTHLDARKPRTQNYRAEETQRSPKKKLSRRRCPNPSRSRSRSRSSDESEACDKTQDWRGNKRKTPITKPSPSGVSGRKGANSVTRRSRESSRAGSGDSRSYSSSSSASISSPSDIEELSDGSEQVDPRSYAELLAKLPPDERTMWHLRTLLTENGTINLEKLVALTDILRGVQEQKNRPHERLTVGEKFDKNRKRVSPITTSESIGQRSVGKQSTGPIDHGVNGKRKKNIEKRR